jgi:hypothetical protein
MRRCLVIFASLLFSIAAAGQHQAALTPAPELPFQAGEKMNYTLLYKWGAVVTEVGDATLQLDSLCYQGVPTYHTGLHVKSAPFFDIFFKMREQFDSWFAASDLRPFKFTRDTYEGGYTATNLYIYDWEQEVIHADVNFGGRGMEHYEIPLKDGVTDLPSLIYSLRATDFSKLVVNRAYPLAFAIDEAVFNVRLTYKGVETLKVRRLGKTQAHHFSCSVVQGAMFEGNQELQFWLSADDSHILVGLMAPLRVGGVWAWVKSTQDLKYPFEVQK